MTKLSRIIGTKCINCTRFGYHNAMTRTSYGLALFTPKACFTSPQESQYQFPRTPTPFFQDFSLWLSHGLEYSSFLAHV
eukprot:Gb_21634 [translate_table: standard]